MEARWYRPDDGTFAAVCEEYSNSPEQQLQPPALNYDWLLLLQAKKPRLLILTDIGGDPDDQQSLIRLMLYANEFRIEGLVASASGTPGELRESIVRPDLIREIVNAYGLVRPRLLEHASGWPTMEDLLARVKSGNPLRGREHIGENHDTEGSRWIVQCADAATPEDPLNISIWGGQTDLAQALWRVRQDRGADGLAALVRRIRVYDIGNQDRIADWMRSEFHGLHYILAAAPPGTDQRLATYRGIYLGGDASLTSRAWVDAHIRSKGPLGALYPVQTWTAPNPHGCLKEGDTPSWFFFLPRGGNHPDNPELPGWGGRFRRESDGWYRDMPFGEGFDPRDEVARWRPQFQADFARRMDWCVSGPDGSPRS